MKKRILSLALAFSMFASTVPAFAAEKSAFSDISGSEYYAQSADVLADMDILAGYEDGTFGADRIVTRAEMAVIICKMLGKTADAEKAKGKTSFADVAAGHWASGFINTAVESGIIVGDGDGNFRPEDEVKHEEAVKMVICALGINVTPDSSDWSKPYLDAASEKGIDKNLKGKKGENAKRGDIAVMVYSGLKSDLYAPVASLSEGTYSGTQKVTLSTVTKGAEIYYTTDGTTPTATDTRYSGAISISKTSTLKAIAVKGGALLSDVMSVEYKINTGTLSGGSGGSKTASYTVSFDLNYDGAPAAPASQKIEENSSAEKPDDPSRDLYNFAGWYTEKECINEYDFAGGVTSDITLYACWYTTDYGISALTTDEQGNAVATVSAAEACTVSVTVYSEDKSAVLGNASASADAGLEDADISVALSGINLPQYYILTADLLDSDGKKLCKTYTCINHTKNYEEFMAKTTDDFDGKTVVNFDDRNDMNFAVLNDDVEKIHISDTQNDINEMFSSPANNFYVIDNINTDLRDIKIGDELYLDYGDGCLLTVASYNIEGDTITIQGSDDYDLKDYFDYIKVDMELDPNSYEEQTLPKYTESADETDINAENEIALMAEIVDVDASLTSLKLAIPVEFYIQNAAETRSGTLSGSVSVEIKPHLVIKWDVHLLSDNYFEFSASLEVKTGTNIKLEYSRTNDSEESTIGYDEMLKKVAEIPMGKVLIPFGVTGLGAEVELTLPLSAEFKCNAQFNSTTTRKIGISYDTINGVKTSKDKTDSKSFKIEGEIEIKVGPKLEESITFLKDVVKASLEQNGGLYLDAKAEGNIVNTDHLCKVCVSGEFGGFLTASAKLSYQVGKHLKGTPIDFTFYDAKWKIVDCYYSSDIGFGWGECPNKSTELDGHCKLSGKITIADADTDNSNNPPLEKARVYLKNNSANQQAITFTNSAGEYKIDNIPAGNYTITISKDNYITVMQQLEIKDNQDNYYNAVIEAISNEDNGSGTASGKITDALTGSGAAGLTLKIRSGLDTLTGDVLATLTSDANGAYTTSELPAGNYTVQIIDERTLSDEIERYYPTLFNIKILGGKAIPNQNGNVTSGLKADQLRIVLRWGATPSDLDSHLVGPGDDGKFHTFYSSKTYYSGGTKFADLDLDDITSYGPETTTIYKAKPGVYTFYVHNYSNRNSSSSSALANSGATVEVYLSNSQTAAMTLNVPNLPGTLWNVFSYDSSTGAITPINTMSYKSDPYGVGLYSLGNASEQDSDIDMIFSDIENAEK